MAKYRRENTPEAMESQTLKGIAKSHIVHSHHYRKESSKKETKSENNLSSPEYTSFMWGGLFYAGFAWVISGCAGLCDCMWLVIVANIVLWVCLIASLLFMIVPLATIVIGTGELINNVRRMRTPEQENQENVVLPNGSVIEAIWR